VGAWGWGGGLLVRVWLQPNSLFASACVRLVAAPQALNRITITASVIPRSAFFSHGQAQLRLQVYNPNPLFLHPFRLNARASNPDLIQPDIDIGLVEFFGAVPSWRMPQNFSRDIFTTVISGKLGFSFELVEARQDATGTPRNDLIDLPAPIPNAVYVVRETPICWACQASSCMQRVRSASTDLFHWPVSIALACTRHPLPLFAHSPPNHPSGTRRLIQRSFTPSRQVAVQPPTNLIIRTLVARLNAAGTLATVTLTVSNNYPGTASSFSASLTATGVVIGNSGELTGPDIPGSSNATFTGTFPVTRTTGLVRFTVAAGGAVVLIPNPFDDTISDNYLVALTGAPFTAPASQEGVRGLDGCCRPRG
jgi:hypothetical protein